MIDNKQHIGFRVDETSMQGIYDLVTPTAVKEPIRTDLERNVRYFAVSQDDQPDISLH
jgi:hypothetical protein